MNKTRAITILVSLACSTSMLVGCAKSGDKDKITYSVNETMTPESKWINSNVEKSVDETTKVSLKDDFYTAVNLKDLVKWEKTVKENFNEGTSADAQVTLDENLQNIISGAELHAPNMEMNEEDLAHNVQLIQDFAQAIGSWETRNKTGVEQLKPFLEDIENIKTMDDLNKFIINKDGKALCDTNLINLSVDQTFQEVEEYSVVVEPNAIYALLNGYEQQIKKDVYNGGAGRSSISKLRDINYKDITFVLSKLGYTESDVDRIIKNCYRIESTMAEYSLPDSYYNTEQFYNSYSANKSIDYLKGLQDSYPLMDILKARNYDKEDKFAVLDDGYIRALGNFYNESNLELFKDMFIVRTVLDAEPLLDEECANEYYKNHVEKEDSTEKDKEKYFEQNTLNLVQDYLRGPLSVVYLSQYVNPEEKEELTKMTDELKEEFKTIFSNEKWLKKGTKKKVLEKLDAISNHILYPDEFESYKFYQIDKDDSLLEMVAKLSKQKIEASAKKINTKVDRDYWDLEDKTLSVIVNNCFYTPTKNGIYILPGYISGGYTYNINMNTEEKYAFMTTIGHEITHAFDKSGKEYDKYGYKRSWWEFSDEIAFENQQEKLVKFYNSITPYPGAKNYDGNTVAGEAAADLGGIKSVLALVKDKKGFDYDKFFRAYAKVDSAKNAASLNSFYAADVHPFSCIRINVAVSQFDEFQKTYDIKPGDGMYVAPKNRILVW